ncbi:MAG TPA: hypothetical protein VGM93_11825, partial [Acidimicrobiales bacterium]
THTRHDARWAEALGWFTAVAPFDVSVPTGHELGDILPTMNAAWADAKRGAALPLSRIGELLGRTLEPRFLVSYLDARHARGANLWPYWRAHAFIGDVGPTDQVYAWINRMPNETYLTWRYPGNDVCRNQVLAVTETMAEIIREIVTVELGPVAAVEGTDIP